MGAVAPEGDERLSGTRKSEGEGTQKMPSQRASKGGREKASPVGRALRSVYDDTLRESVPNDFLDLLRKLD